MPDIPISQLPETTSPASTDVVPLVDGTTTKKAQLANLYSGSSGSSLVGFLQAGTGAVARDLQSKERERISCLDFSGVDPTGVSDSTTGLQNWLNACKGKRGYWSAGKYKISSALQIDPAACYDIEGDGYDPNAAVCTVINNTGVGKAINIDNLAGTANDNLIRLSDFLINGNSSSQQGLYAAKIPGLRLERVWSVNNGYHGFHLERCYNAGMEYCLASQNGRHGIFLDKQANAVLLKKCISNTNSRSDGYYNIAVVGTAGNENLSVTLIGCDYEGAGTNPYTTVTTAYGLVVQYTNSITIQGTYAEGNKSGNLYADSTVQNATFIGNYHQDGDTQFANCGNLVAEGNTFTRVGAATTFTVIGPNNAARNGCRIGRNTYNGGATKNFGGAAVERQEQFGTAAPSTGTYEVGDIVWRNNYDLGLNRGWQCTVAGTPGTWIPFGIKEAVFADQGDAGVTLTWLSSYPTNIWASPLTANRAVALSTTGAQTGAKFRITRLASSTGASTLDVGTGPLKSLAAGQWCDVEYQGAAWRVTAFGSL